MNYAVVFAGGRGTRMKFGDKPKQFLEIDGKPILCHTLDRFERHAWIDGIMVVSNPDFMEETKALIRDYGYQKVIDVVVGGKNPIDSQYNGLLALNGIAKENDVILLHDGVRPLIDGETIGKCIETTEKMGNAITVAPAIETIALLNAEGLIDQTVARNKCMLARAPQAVRFSELMMYHERSIGEGVHNFIDTASMLLYYGISLNVVLGSQDNIKVTTISDYYTCKALLEMGKSDEKLY